MWREAFGVDGVEEFHREELCVFWAGPVRAEIFTGLSYELWDFHQSYNMDTVCIMV